MVGDRRQRHPQRWSLFSHSGVSVQCLGAQGSTPHTPGPGGCGLRRALRRLRRDRGPVPRRRRPRGPAHPAPVDGAAPGPVNSVMGIWRGGFAGSRSFLGVGRICGHRRTSRRHVLAATVIIAAYTWRQRRPGSAGYPGPDWPGTRHPRTSSEPLWIGFRLRLRIVKFSSPCSVHRTWQPAASTQSSR